MNDDSTKHDVAPAEPQELPQRLCSEIQLFDLCDKDACSHRSGRYCTHGETLARFEAISEEDDTPGIMEDVDDMEDADDLDDDEAYDDEYDSEGSDEEY